MIDLCVCLSGPFLNVMLPFFFKSLLDCHDMSQVRLHIVMRDESPLIEAWLKHIPATVYSLPQKFDRRGTREAPVLPENTVADCAGACRWMLENCGTEPIAFISHFDILFTRPILNYFIDQFRDGIGQTGSHGSGLVGFRRAAVAECGVEFDAVSGFCLVRDQYSNWKLRHRSDPRCTDTNLPIHAFDVGELVEMALSARGWGIVSAEDQWLNGWRNHLGTGSGHTGDLGQKRAQAMEILNEMELKAIC